MAEVAGTGLLLPSRAALHRRCRRPTPSPQAPLGLAMALGTRRTPTVSQRRHRRLTSAILSDDTTASPTPLPLAPATTINTPRLLLLLHTPFSVCTTVCRFPGTTPMNTWIDSSMWSPDTWSVFNMSVRTNNDVEGWHRRLNSRSRANEHLYKLIELLYTEASLVPVQVQLVKERKLKRYQKKHFKNMQGRLFTLWDHYINKEIKASQLLAACSHLAAPCIE
ncbi:hypothetical protein GWK47_053698 [Chionoecetes opilio]|uniref:Uncharacterized protein n=1 Tax=Chionoecetes opilio TaxID=41210 RepID=A0A8J5CQH3_CHIOP|nr:hypothetical protein GWK47_053698 [Chionoecetes opilio]